MRRSLVARIEEVAGGVMEPPPFMCTDIVRTERACQASLQ